MRDKRSFKAAAGKLIKCLIAVIICVVCSLGLTLLALAGLESSNIMFALAQGNELQGCVVEKVEFRGTYRLLIKVDGYETLDYSCTEEIYQRYQVGDSVALGIDIVVH